MGSNILFLTFFFGFFQVGSDVPCELLHKVWLCRVSVPVGAPYVCAWIPKRHTTPPHTWVGTVGHCLFLLFFFILAFILTSENVTLHLLLSILEVIIIHKYDHIYYR